MATPEVFGGLITHVDPKPLIPGPPDTWPTVRIALGEDELVFRLPPNTSPFTQWAVYNLSRMQRPVYLTVVDGAILDCRLAIVGRVTRFHERRDGPVDVTMDSSPQRLLLPAAFRKGRVGVLLEEAWRSQGIVMVDADDCDGISTADPAPWRAWGLAPLFVHAPGAAPFNKIVLEPVSEKRLGESWRIVAGLACPPALAGGCVPFDYPNTGCNARAHEMCNVLAANGIQAAKAWLFDRDMKIATRNYECACDISWTFHVVPYVRVEGKGLKTARLLDPALFDGPVSFVKFVKALHSGSSQARFSRREFYFLGDTGGALELPHQCDRDLECLREKARSRHPQPPYC